MNPRGEFLATLFRVLDREGVAYCVLRNYENLYEGNSSDVDLAVQAEEVPGLKNGLAEAAGASGHRLVQAARYINYSHVYWHPEGGFVRVDFDTEFRWRVFPVLSAKAVITLRRKAGAFYIPHPRHESAILFLAAIERGELSERYRQRLGKLYEQLAGPEELRRTFRAVFGAAGADLAACQATMREKAPETSLWKEVRRSVVRNSFRDGPSRGALGRYFCADLARLWERLRKPAGICLLYASAAPTQASLDTFLQQLEALFPASKRVVSSGMGWSELGERLDFAATGDARTPGEGEPSMTLRLRWQCLRVLFKGGLFVRCHRLERDTDLQKSVRTRTRFLFPARSFTWAECSDGKAFLAHAKSGLMAEFNPRGDGRVLTQQVIQFISAFLKPGFAQRRAPQRGALVVLVGLDGSGKTTVAREICRRSAGSEKFRQVRYFHWRPAIFGQAALPLPEFKNVPRKPKLSGNLVRSVISAGRVLKNLVLSNLAYRCRVGPEMSRGGLVLVDRYYYNYYLDPVSVKYYGPDWLLDRLCPFFPRPDLVVVLRAPAEVLLARKQELSAAEICRQNAVLDQVPFGAREVLDLDASRPAEETAGAILMKLEGL